MAEESEGHKSGTEAMGSADPAAVALPPPGDQVSLLWARLKEHRVAQWSIGYVAVAYGIQHAVTLTIEAMDWPHGLERASLILLALGLPVAITLAWYHGERVNRRISGPELAIISLLLVGISFLFYVFVRPSEQTVARPEAAAQTVTAAVPAIKAAGISVAVLPFLNLSGDPKEEYFSDGMTEEITSALAKVPNLPVVGRTSAFAFKGKNEDLQVIGRALRASYLLEGSVRKAGDRVRITAQLIKAETGDHVWTDSYDRNLTDIFAVQEDVAKAIAAALQVPLGLSQGESLVSNRDIDPDSYQDYLRAEALIRSRSVGTPLTAPIALLEGVVARQPNYAPAWALLAQGYARAPRYDPNFDKGSIAQLRSLADAYLPKAEAAARRATQLDPRNADAWTALGLVQDFRGNLLDAEQSFKQALSMDPLNPETLHGYSEFLAATGQIKQAMPLRQQLRAIEPLAAAYNSVSAVIFWIAGDNTQAVALAQGLPNAGGALARIYADMGRYQNAADAVLKLPRNLYPPTAVNTAARLLRSAPTAAQDHDIPYLGELSWVFVYVGIPDRVFDVAEHDAESRYTISAVEYEFWWPDLSMARKSDRFKTLVRKLGLVDYWRVKGWPQFCHPTSGDDFVCD